MWSLAVRILDSILSRLEYLTSLLEQWGIKGWIIDSIISAALGVSAALTGSAIPWAITCGLLAMAAMSVIRTTRSFTSAWQVGIPASTVHDLSLADDAPSDPPDSSLDQLIRVHIVPSGNRTSGIADSIAGASLRKDNTMFFYDLLKRLDRRLLGLSYDLLHCSSRTDQQNEILKFVEIYFEIEQAFNHLVPQTQLDEIALMRYEEWKQSDAKLKRELTTHGVIRGNEELYNRLEHYKWIVT